MPTYAYACTACGHEFDAQQSFSEASLTECPQCHGRLRKKFGAVGVVFKGSGFYRTDSRGGSSGAVSGSSGSESSGSSGSSGSSSDSGSSTSSPAPAAAGSSSGSSRLPRAPARPARARPVAGPARRRRPRAPAAPPPDLRPRPTSGLTSWAALGLTSG